MNNYFKFEILHQSTKSKARVGKIHTKHGIIDTPTFVPVATNASLKAIPLENQSNIDLMFCNTYHLMVHPGTNTIKNLGGLHKFMNRSSPIITDSGGFQVFSLAYGSVYEELKSCGKKKNKTCVLKLNEEGVLFRSYRDGSELFLSPESSIQAQKNLGADIIIPFDELPPYHFSLNELKKSCERTHRWEERSLKEHLKNPNDQAIFAVVHGGINHELRKNSCSFLSNLPFDGFAIGGSVGKTKQELFEIVSFTKKYIPNSFPTHLLGIGDPESIEKLVSCGIDSFDSSYPTKAARHGSIFYTQKKQIKIKQNSYKENPSPIDKRCSCSTCKQYSLAYLHHLFKSHEFSYLSLLSIHNIQYMTNLMKEIREKILRNEI